MKTYKVIQSPEAKEQMKKYLAYLLFVIGRKDSYNAVKNDYKETLKRLSTSAGSVMDSKEPELAKRNLKKFFFESHRYVMLYRIKDGEQPIAEVVYIFHTLEDYLSKID